MHGFTSGLSILFHWSLFLSLYYCSFVIYFEIRKYDASSFILPVQDCFCYLGSYMNFRIVCGTIWAEDLLFCHLNSVISL